MAALFHHDAEKKGFSESDKAVGAATSFDEEIWSLGSVDVALDRKMRCICVHKGVAVSYWLTLESQTR